MAPSSCDAMALRLRGGPRRVTAGPPCCHRGHPPKSQLPPAPSPCVTEAVAGWAQGTPVTPAAPPSSPELPAAPPARWLLPVCRAGPAGDIKYAPSPLPPGGSDTGAGTAGVARAACAGAGTQGAPTRCTPRPRSPHTSPGVMQGSVPSPTSKLWWSSRAMPRVTLGGSMALPVLTLGCPVWGLALLCPRGAAGCRGGGGRGGPSLGAALGPILCQALAPLMAAAPWRPGSDPWRHPLGARRRPPSVSAVGPDPAPSLLRWV